MTRILYDQAARMASACGSIQLIDAYCGTGTISLALSDSFEQVIGIESYLPSVEDARNNALVNAVTNAAFIHGRTEDELAALMAVSAPGTVLLVDPPRAGLDRRAVETIIDACPPALVYISCNPATLARDVKLLTASGYELQEVQVVDMFPMSGHVEAIILMTRSGSGEKK